jgi:hypothetical protein
MPKINYPTFLVVVYKKQNIIISSKSEHHIEAKLSALQKKKEI